MKTIIMTVGTSLLTNPDKDLRVTEKRPWVEQKTIGDYSNAVSWMARTPIELISAETNTLYRLDPSTNDEIILLHSETASGLECAGVLKLFFEKELGQKSVKMYSLPGINYDVNSSEPALAIMAKQLTGLINNATGEVTLAATGGFKAQTMIMALVGNSSAVPVCYIHEEFKGLVFIPYLSSSGQPENRIRRANLPVSGVPRDKILQFRSDNQEPNRPRFWKKVKEELIDIPWIDRVYYDERAYSAPENGVKGSPQKTEDGRRILWVRLVEKDKKMAVAIETTGRTPEQLSAAAGELTERLGRSI
ncbi:MAG: hypothetical protein N5P05_001728 [Chroococcopsis gigantea SAG 12.99]|jgi:putative CRISPR-associated protein (TIGR02619 family)|nr:putative CRISPR-associated protein [Chlorogloea purpurea SAG 13.99]MDV3000122.1 hypothetical protein [Chroococcopsis gigantea SAG 12.99]